MSTNTTVTTKQFEETGFGKLHNPGKDCYMNSAFQVLLNNKKIVEFFLTLQHNGTSTKDIVISNLITFFKTIWEKKNDKVLNPSTLKKNIRQIHKKYCDIIEHDSHEFFFDLLDIIHSVVGTDFVANQHGTEHLSAHKQEACKAFNSYFDNKKSIISKTFYGQFIKRFSCSGECSNVFFNYDLFNGFTVFPNGNGFKISELISKTFLRDFVPYECLKCDPDGNSDKEHSIDQFIYKLPEVLIVTVNRFNHDGTKNDKIVVIDDELDLGNYYFGTESTKYVFSSVICHLGNVNNGHYATIAKRGEKSYIFDDSQVRSFTEENKLEQLNGSLPYVIFYTKK